MSEGLIKSWSPSRLFDYEMCPRKVKYSSIDHLCPTCFNGELIWIDNVQTCNSCNREPAPADALINGTEVHSAAELFIRCQTNDVDPRLGKVLAFLILLRDEYKARRVRVEFMAAVDRNWKPVAWKSRDAYCRAKIDVLWLFEPSQVCVIDWKTGKLKKNGEYGDQLNIYSVVALSYGFGDVAQSKLVFTDFNEEVTDPKGTVFREGLAAEQRRWDRRALPMLSDTKFAPRPGPGCTWCDYSCNKGGPCEY